MSLTSSHSYGSSKRFIELLHCYLATHPHTPQYFLTHPGIVDSGIIAPYEWPFREIIQGLKRFSFYTARMIGSPWHSISPENGACSMIYCALRAGKGDEMMKWGCGSDWWGRERLIGSTLSGEADLFEEECTAAFEFVERLYQERIFKLGASEKGV
jgi:3-keto steroid reductase